MQAGEALDDADAIAAEQKQAKVSQPVQVLDFLELVEL